MVVRFASQRVGHGLLAQKARTLALGLLVSASLGGCRKPSAENLGVVEAPAATSAPATAQPSREQVGRSDGLIQLAALPHAELASRMGPHRVESSTRWVVTPVQSQKPGTGTGTAQAPPRPPEVQPGFKAGDPVNPYEGSAAWDSAPVTLDEERVIEVDAAGRLHAQSQNDHGYGVEAVLDQEFLYMRMRYAPYVRRRSEGDEATRLRAVAYEPGAAIMEVVAPYLKVSIPTETTFVGRPAWIVTLSRKDASPGVLPAAPPGGKPDPSAWRAATAVEQLEGVAVIDRERGTLLDIKLDARFVSPRGTGAPTSTGRPPAAPDEKVQVEVHHRSRVAALGSAVAAVAVPAEWIDPPTRPRPMLDKQELLSGLGTAKP